MAFCHPSGADINECLEGDFCFPRGECMNTEGSFKCVCALGYKSTVNGTSCQGMTPDVIYSQHQAAILHIKCIA